MSELRLSVSCVRTGTQRCDAVLGYFSLFPTDAENVLLLGIAVSVFFHLFCIISLLPTFDLI